MADQIITDLARARAGIGPDGQRLSIDQLRSDAFFDVFRRIRDGQPPPTRSPRREREIGLVLNADTRFGEGPAAHDPGERRGLGTPVPVDPTTAREEADTALAHAAGMCVLLADARGVLLRALRLTSAPPSGWTRKAVEESVRARLPDLPPLHTGSYTPTVPIVEHVPARNPRCTGYDCPRVAHRCDLDHDQPWPRGPTEATNLAPRCRRDHELKTRGLLRTHLHADGSVDTRLLSGIALTTRPEPLPGFGIREGYGPQPRDGESDAAA